MVADASLLEINATFVVEVIAFIVLVLIFARYAYPKIMAAAEARQNQIEAALKEAQRQREEARTQLEGVRTEIEEAKNQANEIVNRAHREAVVEAEDVRGKARADAEALLQRAEAEIGAERDRAIQDLRSEVASLAVETATKVIGEVLDEKAQRQLIDKALVQVGDARARPTEKN